jgi:L-idonate 5-dehydrogenase
MGSAATLPHTQGGMCDYIYVKRWMIKVLPSHLSLRAGALAEPLAVALHGIALAGEIRGKRILVSGSGPIGLLTIAAAKKRGVRSITATDLVPTALERARVLGADSLINVSEEKLPADSYDVIFECSGNPDAVNAALSAVERGGTIVQIGMISRIKPEISIGLVVTKELRFLGAFRFNEAIGEMDEAISFLATEPNCEKCISHTFPFEKVVEGFVTARDSALSGKVLIEF